MFRAPRSGIAPRLFAVVLLVSALLPTPVAATTVSPVPHTGTPVAVDEPAPEPVVERVNLVSNGSFEEPVIAGTSQTVTGVDSLPGWSLAGSADIVRCDPGPCAPTGIPWTAEDGAQSVDIAASNKTGTISQTLATPVGHEFTLSFAYLPGPRDNDRKADAKVNISFGGQAVSVTLESRAAGGANVWRYASVSGLTATTAESVLSFKGIAGRTFGFAVDDVRVVDDTADNTPDPVEVDAPVLFRAAPAYDETTSRFSLGTVLVAGSLVGDPGAYELSFYAGASCAAITTSTTPFGTWTLTKATGDATDMFVTSEMLASLPASTPFVAAKVTGPASTPGTAGKVSSLSNCVVYSPENDTWPRALEIPISGGTGTAAFGTWIDEPGLGRWFKVDVAPGGSVTVDLTNLPADFDVYLFRDIRQAYEELQKPQDLTLLTAEFAGSGFSGSGFSGSGFSGSGFSGSGFSGSGFSADSYSGSGFSGSGFSGSGFSGSGFSGSGFSGSGFSGSGFSGSGFSGSGFSGSGFSGSGFSGSGFSAEDYSAAQYYSLVDWSVNLGTADEFAGANTWTATGDFYLRVNGKNGVSSTAAPFSIQLTVDADLCEDVTYVGSAPGPIANDYRTLILTDTSRFSDSFTSVSTTALEAKLAELAAQTEGVVIDFAGDTRVAQLQAQAYGTGNQACVYAKNLVAEAMKDVVDAYREGSTRPGGPEYVVLAGSDDVIPFFRYPDTASLAPEQNFFPPVGGTSNAALRNNYVLGQDAYGSSRSVTLGPVEFPLPREAVGRLVETPNEIIGMVQAWLDIEEVNGVRAVSPTTSAVTGYDFVADAAEDVLDSLERGTNGTAEFLLQPYGEAPDGPNTWSADDLKTLLDTPKDITFLAGHFSEDQALAADYQSVLTAQEFLDITENAKNTILFSIGCHSGYNLVDGDYTGIEDHVDWPQAFAREQITSILGTGYQYGDTDFMEYSERIYAEFARQLLYTTQADGSREAVAMGKALNSSKIEYLKTTFSIEDLHLKSLLEAGLYGLPMFGVDMPAGRVVAPAGSGSVALLDFAPAVTGLKYVDKSVNTTGSTPDDKPLDNTDTPDPDDTLTATWYQGPAGVKTQPGAPALPLYAESATPNLGGYVLRGVGFRGGAFTDIPGIVPLTGAPAIELSTPHTSFDSPVFYPGQMWRANYWGALLGVGGETSLLVTPAQHKATNPGEPEVLLRLYQGLDLRLYYINADAPGAKSLAPVIYEITTDTASNEIGARVVGDPAAGIHEVWVTYNEPDSDSWASFNLQPVTGDPTLWKGTTPDLAAGTLFMVQAANGAGLVSVNDNFGAYFLWGAAPDPAPTAITLGGATSGTYGTTAQVTATLTSDGAPVSGKQVIVTIGASTRSGTTNASGQATIDVPLASAAGSYSAVASFLGDGLRQPSGASRQFTINKAATTVVVTCPDTSLTATGLPLTPCTARATSPAGLNEPVNVTYTGNVAAGTATATATYPGDVAHTSDTGSAQFTIAADGQTITFDPLTDKTFGNEPFTVSATASSGLPVTFSTLTTDVCTVDGSTVTIVGAGTCTITASQDGNSQFGAATPVSQSYTVNKKTATLTLDTDDLSQTYGATRAVDVTTDPANLTGVVVTYEGIDPTDYTSSTTPPTDAGSYTVRATLDNANYTATPATGTLVIGKANQSISFDTLDDKTFGDAPFTVSATATSGLAVTFEAAGDCSVDGDEVTITRAGSCTITARQAGDDNWNAAAGVSRQFSINKATADLTLVAADLEQTYTGTPRSVGVTTDPAGLTTVTLTYEGIAPTVYPSSTTPPTDAGSYTVTATLDDANYTATPATGTLVIGKASSTTTITCPASVAFTGSALTPCSATATGAGGLSASVTVTYANNTAVGTATADATYAGGPNHLGSTAVQKTFQIIAATATLTIDTSDLSQTYGATRAVDVTTNPANLTGVVVTYEGIDPTVYASSTTPPTDAGSYTVTATLDNANYTATPDTGTLVIAKAATTTVITCPTTGQTYTGSALEPCTVAVTGAGGLDTTTTITYASNENVGTATADATYAGSANHLGSTAAQATFQIIKATATLTIDTSDLSQTYGATRAVDVTTDPANLDTVTVSYLGISGTYYGSSTTPPTNAGSYQVTATLDNANYTGLATAQLTIAKAASSTVITCPTTDQVYTGSALEPCTAAVTGAGGLDTTTTVTHANNVNAGTATANASYAESANHLGSTAAEATFAIVEAATTTVITCPASVSFTGSALTPCTATVTGAGLIGVTAPVTYANNTAVGTATANATYVGGANHLGSTAAEVTFEIVQASFRIEYQGTWFEMVGTTPSLTARILQDQAITEGGTPLVNYESSAVTARFTLSPASCASVCPPASVWTGTVRVNKASDWSDTGAGVATVSAPSNLAAGAYLVTVTVEANTFVSARAANAGLVISASSGTNVVGGGFIPADSTAAPDDRKGYFAFNVRRSGSAGTGSLLYVYRALVNPATGLSCSTPGMDCRLVDVTVRSTAISNVTTTKSATWPVNASSTGNVTVRFIDVLTGSQVGAALTGTYRLDVTDQAPGGANDTFGLSVYVVGTSGAYHVASGETTGQSGTGVAATKTQIGGGDISAPPGNR